MSSSLSIFPPPGRFVFSPISFHAAFITETEVTMCDIQDSKFLFQTKKGYCSSDLGVFSPDGHFFAFKLSDNDIWVWSATSTGYQPWNTLRCRGQFQEFLFSPTSTSILCSDFWGIQLLDIGSHPNSFFHTIDTPHGRVDKHLVAFSSDLTYIATTRKWNTKVSVLDTISETSQEYPETEIKIEDMKIVDCHEICFLGLISCLHDPIFSYCTYYSKSFFLWTTFLILICLLTPHQERGPKTNQTWD